MLRSRMRLAFPLLLGSAVCLSIVGLAPQGKSQTYEGRQLVHAALVADTKAIVPGKSFTVGLLLRMAPGWHTYWKFSGDAGLPSEVKWNLPDGWKVGDIQWPIPLKTTDPGDIQTYGYQDEVLLMQEIIPPAKIDSSSVKLSPEANWLCCEKSASREAPACNLSCQHRQPVLRQTPKCSRASVVCCRKIGPAQRSSKQTGPAPDPIFA